MKIFLAEDNEDNYLIVKSNLKRMEHPFELIRAQDGLEAVAMLESPTLLPDLFLIDIAMPGLNGIELIAWIKSQPRLKDIPAIAMTASVFAQMKKSYRSHGFSHILEKPFVRKEFIAMLEKVMK